VTFLPYPLSRSHRLSGGYRAVLERAAVEVAKALARNILARRWTSQPHSRWTLLLRHCCRGNRAFTGKEGGDFWCSG
jgi:hypothetical protein